MNAKPHLRIVEGQAVQVCKRESSVEAARRRHGKPFAHESGSTWKRNVGLHDENTCLSRWLAEQIIKRKA